MRISSIIAMLLASSTAAVHAERAELTEKSPSTLEPGEFRIGVVDIGVGLFGHKLLERIEVSTRPLLWSGWAFGTKSYDARAKFEFWREGALSLSVGIGHTLVDFGSLAANNEEGMKAAELAFKVTPIEGWAAYRLGDSTRVTAGLV